MDVNVKGDASSAARWSVARWRARAGARSSTSRRSTGSCRPSRTSTTFRRARGETFVKPVAYSVSKSAILNLTRYLATYWAKAGVRVNTLTLAGVWNDQPAGVPRGVHGARAAGAHARRRGGARRARLPRLRRLVVRHRRERRRRRRLVGLVAVPAEIPNLVGGAASPAASGAVAGQAAARGREPALPGRALRGGRRRGGRVGGPRGPAGVGGAHRRRARERAARPRPPPPGAARGALRDRRRGDGQEPSSSRAGRRTPRSRWGSSSRARAVATTAGRRRRACRTAPCSPCGSRSASPG